MVAINQIHIALYAAAVCTCITVIAYTLIQKRTDRTQNKAFLGMLFIVFLNATAATASALVEPFKHVSRVSFSLLLMFQFLYFTLHTALCPMLYVYVECVIGTFRRRSRLYMILISLPFIITELFCLSNPFTDIVYYYDRNLEFHRNWGEYAIYIVAAVYFSMSILSLFISWSAITGKRKMAILYFFVITVVGVVIQFIDINIKSELFAESLALMGLMLAVESEDDRIDHDGDVYNRRALKMDVDNVLARKDRIAMVFVKIINSGYIERVTGSYNSDMKVVMLADFLKALVPKYKIYHPNEDCFVLYIDNVDSAKHIRKEIENRFDAAWNFGGNKVTMDAVVFDCVIPEDLSTAEDIFYAIDCIIPPSVNKNVATIDYISRRAEIESLLKNSIDEGLFEVYYQPTYTLDGMKLHGAEALVRMKKSEKLGYISPEEFIPIAEQIGLVDDIDDFVIRSVCEFLASEDSRKIDIDCINVNLSVVQCLRNGFVDHLLRIVNRYHIDKSRLNFEITETFEAGDYNKLASVAAALKKQGFSLSMDDYGTGYSNIGSIFSLDFDVVKFDKSILWNAQNDEQGMIILEKSIRMILDLGLQVLVEGVESEEHIALLKPMGVHFLQGYYFSKPVPRDEFIRICSM